MVISVASGKGGTGKTTVATNLAVSIGSDVRFLDCDVEAPNAHLFLNPSIEEIETVKLPVPEIDFDKCTFCKKCAEICRFKAIAVIGTTVLTFPELCHSCGGCFLVCPEKAIIESYREIGVIEKGHANHIKFINGSLRVGEAMSPPLIRKVIQAASEDSINIVDAPPGTSCPVIAAINGSDFVLMVTEPTPFGLHDLKLAVEAVKILNIPAGLIINRCDKGDGKVLEYAKKENLPVLMEIPFDRHIAEIYSVGALLAQDMPEWKQRFKELYGRIKNLVLAKREIDERNCGDQWQRRNGQDKLDSLFCSTF